ncbi:hypothetical protein OIU77_012503 [Salix suchowensis]|uniref:Uncharacterized protein n=1 Tax=Salix suchowensis TaxID=1278906 RepID=A0ABQ9A420_9ROSI|nr:hypothetical protein OIU77_012503 [Salix suchowensis]
MEEKKTEMANKNAKKAKSLGSPLNQAHSGRIRLRDCYKSWICRRCEDEQYKVVLGGYYYSDCASRSVLQQEVPSESGIFDRMHRIVYSLQWIVAADHPL